MRFPTLQPCTEAAMNMGTYKEILNSDEERFGGTGRGTSGQIKSNPRPMHGHEQSISLELAGMSTIYLKLIRKAPVRKKSSK